jgi:hypothetical protein
MARKGSAAAAALGSSPDPGVVPGAFDSRLGASRDFLFTWTRNTAFEIARAGGATVANVPPELTQMHRIAPGKHVRSDVAKWAEMTMVLQGGRKRDAASRFKQVVALWGETRPVLNRRGSLRIVQRPRTLRAGL